MYHITITQPQLGINVICMHVSCQALAACSSIVQLLAGQRRRFRFSICQLCTFLCVYVPTRCVQFHPRRAQANMLEASVVQALPCVSVGSLRLGCISSGQWLAFLSALFQMLYMQCQA